MNLQPSTVSAGETWTYFLIIGTLPASPKFWKCLKVRNTLTYRSRKFRNIWLKDIYPTFTKTFNPSLFFLFCTKCFKRSGNPHWRGRLRTVDLDVLTCLDYLLFISKALFIFCIKQSTLTRRSTVLSLLFQLVFGEKKKVTSIANKWPKKLWPFAR
jgi:hypothetical protein